MGTIIEIYFNLEHFDNLEQITVHDGNGKQDDMDFYLDGRLAKENAKLRRELDFYKSQVEDIEEERLRLKKRWNKAVTENAKLKRSAERDEYVLESLNLSLEESQAENNKLREFAKLYLTAVSIDCSFCPYNDPELCDTETDPMYKGCKLWKEMQKLGINIDS